MEALQQPWQVQEKVMETDINALQWVEDLEQRVIAADLHLKVRNRLTFCVAIMPRMKSSQKIPTYMWEVVKTHYI